MFPVHSGITIGCGLCSVPLSMSGHQMTFYQYTFRTIYEGALCEAAVGKAFEEFAVAHIKMHKHALFE